MQITLVQGLLIALLVFICAFDKHMEAFSQASSSVMYGLVCRQVPLRSFPTWVC